MKLRIQPRQTGKSYDIAESMKEDAKEGKMSICVQPTERAKKQFCKRFNIDEKKVLTFHQLFLFSKDMDEGTIIYVDEISCCLEVAFPRFIFERATFTGEFEIRSAPFGERR